VDVVELAGAAAQVQAREDRPRLPVGRDAPVGLQQRVAILDQPRGPLLDRDQLTVGDDLDRDALVDLDTIDTDVAAGPLRRVEGHEGRRRITVAVARARITVAVARARIAVARVGIAVARVGIAVTRARIAVAVAVAVAVEVEGLADRVVLTGGRVVTAAGHRRSQPEPNQSSESHA